jgi:cation diffusion facilitator family transporter
LDPQFGAELAVSKGGSRETHRARARAVRRVLLWTLGLNLAVAAAKVAYGYWANALSVRADGFHSLTDAGNNLVGLIAVSAASRPADQGHPYGHQKFELIAATLVGVSLLTMAYDVVRSAQGRLLSAAGHLPHIGPGAFAVLSVTLAVNLCVAHYERRQGERLASSFLLSDALHTRSDVLVTCGVLVATVFVRLGYPILDLVAALAVAVFIGWAGILVLRRNMGYLADSAQLDRDQIESVVTRIPGVASCHKIRTRGSPGAIFVDLHIQIAPHLDVVRAHRVTHAVIDAIKESLEGVADVLVHTEPARPDQPYVPLADED